MIRPACPDDAEMAVPLIYEAIGEIAHNLADTDKEPEVIEVLSTFFRLPRNRLSYENTLVKVLDGAVVGVMVSYPGEDSETLDRPYIQYAHAKGLQREKKQIPREADEDEYYLDTLSVSKSYQRQGIGREFLHAFEGLAKLKQFDKLGLLVEPTNEAAARLYHKVGYVPDGIRMIGSHPYVHMVKRRNPVHGH